MYPSIASYCATVAVFCLLGFLVVNEILQNPSRWNAKGIVSCQTSTNSNATKETIINIPLDPQMMRPRNLNIVMIGDSLMRYQYLSLAYFLRHGRWFDPTMKVNNLVEQPSFKNPLHGGSTWKEFYLQSTRILYPNELCDCYHKSDFLRTEHRYYLDPVYNNSIVYVQVFGHNNTIRGHVNAPFKQDHYDESLVNGRQTPFVWQEDTWHDLVRNYVARLDPKPDVAILNAGKWPTDFATNKELGVLLKQSLDDAGIHALWRTNTYSKMASTTKAILDIDEYMCDLLPCWNVSWTRRVPNDFYFDNNHFFEPIYRLLNEDMLSRLHVLPNEHESMANPFT